MHTWQPGCAKFLSIMVPKAVPASSSSLGRGATGEETRTESGNEVATQPGGLEDMTQCWLDDDVVVEGLSDLDAVPDLGLTSDLFSWWESIYGRNIFPQIP
ncbi:hypothetical protein FOQG_15282 [Fusarium oxysporum f. sp. raphani 54005]|uniref:Uncharacterized protein n=1 Tax=Fusarium oxysporum f. sp. raphani 54005 TaxID=1089458 RepID=X0BDC6_FUSOX|nr:hypothetical protein FOQG_15282 [Fusarium oxysporum f. sp. raphani 54005]